jgi:excisionase family DNA binding protein
VLSTRTQEKKMTAKKLGIADRAEAGPDGLARLDDAGRFLAVSRSALYSLMDRGDLKFVKLGKSRRIPWRELQRIAGEEE